jgi:hypothetical protein
MSILSVAPPYVSGDHADQDGDHPGNQPGDERDDQGIADRKSGLPEDILPVRIRAEPVLCRWLHISRDNIPQSRVIRRKDGQDGQDHDDQEDDEADRRNDNL